MALNRSKNSDNHQPDLSLDRQRSILSNTLTFFSSRKLSPSKRFDFPNMFKPEEKKPFATLHSDIVSIILSNLTYEELAVVRTVSKYWNRSVANSIINSLNRWILFA